MAATANLARTGTEREEAVREVRRGIGLVALNRDKIKNFQKIIKVTTKCLGRQQI